VRRVQRLLVALAIVIAGWGAAWAVSSTRDTRCTANDLTGCDALGSVLLFLLLFALPFVVLVLLTFLVLDLIDLRGRRTRSGQDKNDA
jgi:hypothetical protein